MKFHFHQWDLYGPAIRSSLNSQHQARRCSTCGAIQIRRITHYSRADVQTEAINATVIAKAPQ